MAENEVKESVVNVSEEHICKRCGFDQRNEYKPVDEAERAAYFKCALAQIPFSKTYELYGGLLQLVFEEATGKLLRLQERAILDLTKENGSMSDAADFSMLSSLVEVRQVPQNAPSRILYSADREKREKLISDHTLPEELLNMPMIQLQSLRNAYVLFTKHCAALMDAAQDKNFWEGDGRN